VAQQNNRTPGPNRLRKASWLALLSLAWLQLSLASHQFDHVVTYLADTCHVCVQLDRADDVAADQPMAVAVPFGAPVYAERLTVNVADAADVRQFDPRAPPVT
jgi:hypothetical protein